MIDLFQPIGWNNQTRQYILKFMNRPHNTRFPVGNARTFLKVALLPDIKLYFMILSTAVYTDLVKSKISVADPGGGSGGSVEPPFGSLISMKNTDLNVYFCSKVPFREFTNPPLEPPFTESWIRPRISTLFTFIKQADR